MLFPDVPAVCKREEGPRMTTFVMKLSVLARKQLLRRRLLFSKLRLLKLRMPHLVQQIEKGLSVVT
jgi:hypothetical protein